MYIGVRNKKVVYLSKYILINKKSVSFVEQNTVGIEKYNTYTQRYPISIERKTFVAAIQRLEAVDCLSNLNR